MSVANDVLALHEDIIEALLLEENSGEHSIVERATRDSTRSEIIGGKEEQLMLPALILSAAAQFRVGRFAPSMVAVPYGDVGVLFCQLTGKQVMVVISYSESLPRVMELTGDYIRKFVNKESRVHLIKSAAEAEQVVRRYLEHRHEHGAANISVDDIAYREVDNRWVISGAWPDFWSRGKHYLVELDARSGLVMRFNSTLQEGFAKPTTLIPDVASLERAAKSPTVDAGLPEVSQHPGEKVAGNVPAETRSPPRPEAAATLTTYCRRCGAIISISDGFCNRCGWPTRLHAGPSGRWPWNPPWFR